VKIESKKVVAIHYTLTDKSGQIVDSSDGSDPLHYLHGFGNIIPGLEDALLGKTMGDKISVSIPPEKAYGVYNENDKIQAQKSQFQGVDELKVGMDIQTRTKEGIKMYRVEKIFGDTVILDGNHALAGETLNFEVEIMDVRDASEEELEHGHVHGPGAHHH
jgi:FKBP-type peptidyl-prolyl cis-trans isomerase SlyD